MTSTATNDTHRPVAEAANRVSIDAPSAVLMAWMGVGLVNVAVICGTPLPPGGLWVRLSHCFFDFGHMAAVGCLSWLLVYAWGRWGPHRTIAGYLALAVVAVLVGYAALPTDLEGFAARFGRPFALWHNLFIVLVSLGIPAAAVLGRWFRHRWWRWLPISLGLGAVITNHFILPHDYPGAHIALVCGAVSLASSALVGACWPTRLAPACDSKRNAIRRILVGALASAGVLSLALWPKPAVLSELLATDSALLVPMLGRARIARSHDAADEPPRSGLVDQPWLTDRSDFSDIPASEPRLAPDDAIIIIVSTDAFRAGVLDNPAYARRLPNIGALARRSVSFTVARSAGSDTRNSLGSLFTSKYFSQLDWKLTRTNGAVLTRDRSRRFNVLLRDEKGFDSLNIASYPPLVNSNGYVTGFQDEVVLPKSKGQRWALSKAMTDVALERLEKHGEGPLFIFMHWMDAHDPYDAGGTEGSEFERYLCELQLYDEQVGRIWAFLDQRGLLGRSIVLFTSDHGEALGEHNIPHHGTSIYEVLVRVPLMLRVPGVLPRHVDQPVTHLDIAPTLLDLMGVATPGDYMGQSLVPFLRGHSPRLGRPIAADQRVVRALYVGQYKVMHYRKVGAVELYDLEQDPTESNNLFGQLGGEDDQMFQALREFFAVHELGDSWEWRR